MTSFALDPRLAGDTLAIGRLPLSRLLLMKDARWPWLILVPERPGASEIIDLSPEDRAELIEEAANCAEALKRLGPVDKINIGALGNIVPQLHVHIIARTRGDPAWPGPVWGAGERLDYRPGEAEGLIARLREAMPLA